jgi:hypothetical protein
MIRLAGNLGEVLVREDIRNLDGGSRHDENQLREELERRSKDLNFVERTKA